MEHVTIVNPLKSQFNALFDKRSSFNSRCEDYSGWTLPYLFTPQGVDPDTDEAQHDFNSVGAQVVNHLANKVAKTLFPAGRPFFRMDMTDAQFDELAKFGLKKIEAEGLLSKAEKAAMKKMASTRMRTAVLAALKSLIVFGNALMYFPVSSSDLRNVQVYSLKDYVVQRDMSGLMVTMILRDNHQVITLPQEIQGMLQAGSTTPMDLTKEVELYTKVTRLADGRYEVYQEIDNRFEVPESRSKFTEKEMPWIPLTWNLERGANYGTGLVEEYAGDFHTLSSLSEALLVLSGIVSDIKILVDPMGSTDVDSLNNSESGTYIHGNADDISFLQLEKFQDMRFLREQMQDYENRIGKGFLMTGSSIRDSERTTAEEVRIVANELEGSFGGVYSRLAEEMQQPIARRIINRMDPSFRAIEPTIVTGVESLSRTSQLDEMMQFFNDLALLANVPERAAERMNYEAIIIRLGTARSIDYEELLLSEDQVQENRKKAMEQEQNAAVAAEQAKNANKPQQPI